MEGQKTLLYWQLRLTNKVIISPLSLYCSIIRESCGVGSREEEEDQCQPLCSRSTRGRENFCSKQVKIFIHYTLFLLFIQGMVFLNPLSLQYSLQMTLDKIVSSEGIKDSSNQKDHILK